MIKRLVIATLGILFFRTGLAQKSTVRVTDRDARVKLASASDTMQYTLGAFIAQWINSNGFLITNPTLFLNGMDDMFKNRPRLIPDSSIGPRVAAYQRAGQMERAARQEQQLFAALRDRPGVGMLPNGVRYVILKTGKGLHPSEADSVEMNLIAKLADGTVVEDTYQNKRTFTATINSFFPGLNDALPMMSEGSRWQLFIPAILAYGERGTTLIPPNSALIIEVELVAVKAPKK